MNYKCILVVSCNKCWMVASCEMFTVLDVSYTDDMTFIQCEMTHWHPMKWWKGKWKRGNQCILQDWHAFTIMHTLLWCIALLIWIGNLKSQCLSIYNHAIFKYQLFIPLHTVSYILLPELFIPELSSYFIQFNDSIELGDRWIPPIIYP